MDSNFDNALPEFGEKAVHLYGVMTSIAMVLVFTSLTLKFAQGSYGNPAQILRALVSAGVVALIIPVFPDWINGLQTLGHSLVEIMGADPASSHDRFARLVGGAVEGDEHDVGFWDVLWADEGGLGKALLYAAIFLAAKLSSAVIWLFYIVQKFLLLFGVALAPAFIGMFLLEPLRSTAANYMLMLMNLILWPLGWAAADLITDYLLKLSAGQKVYEISDGNAVLTGSQSLFFIIVITVWILFSTIYAPLVVRNVLSKGANVGSEILARFGASLGQGASYGLGAGVTAGMAGGSRGAVMTASAAGGLGGLASGAVGASSALLPAVIGVGAAAISPAAAGGSNQQIDQEAAKIAKKSQS